MPFESLPPQLVVRALDFGEGVVDRFAAGKQSSRQSSRGAEANADLWAAAKLAECAFCQWAKIDVDLLRWDFSQGPDLGHDVVWQGLRVDVKWTRTTALIWPAKKVADFDAKPFDLFVMVKGTIDGDTFDVCRWISKTRFGKVHRIDGGNLDPGTLFVLEDDMGKVDERFRAGAVAVDAGMSGEYVRGEWPPPRKD